MVDALSALTQFDVIDGVGASCFDPLFSSYLVKVLWSSLLPIGIVALIWVAYFIRRLLIPGGLFFEEIRVKVFSQHMHATLLLSYCILPTVTQLQVSWSSRSERVGFHLSKVQTRTNCSTEAGCHPSKPEPNPL